MAKTRGSKEGLPKDSSMSMPAEQKTSESNKQKISRIHDMFPSLIKDNIAKILQYYDDDESQALNAITSDGGREALSNWSESGNSKNKNNKNKKKKKKAKRDAVSEMSATASFDADDSSSLHSGGNIDADVEKDPQQAEIGNSILDDDHADHPNEASNVERLSNEVVGNEPETVSESIPGASASSAPEESTLLPNCDSERDKIPPPSPDTSEKHDEHVMKKDKYRSIENNYQKYPPRQRVESFRRSKSSSMSEDQSSQHNSQSVANPTKRGYEKCKKDLNRQTISLQRIYSQVDKGFEESSKKIIAEFAKIKNWVDQRQKELETELEKNKVDAINLIKGRQDLAVELKRRVDRASLSETEWSDLRSDVKQFVTERKYDDDLGKTIWFHWTDIEEIIKNFGEVTPVKNVYSQRSQSSLGNSVTSNNPEPSPSSSLANDEESAADKNDVANISDAVEETPMVEKGDLPTYNKTHSSENRTTRVYSNTKLNQGRYPGNNQGHGLYRNKGGYNRMNYSYNRQNNNYEGNYRNHPHPHHQRDGRMNEAPYSHDRNMNNPREFKYRNPGRGNNRNFNNNNRYRNNMGGHRHQEKHPEEPMQSATGNTEKNNVNGFVNN